ncbi:WhiB family transcriptional regulator [Streptomyces minutiscleroticus]|uniref:Transcriptional regulator WhiB n=1 Tax=Streptomyces minutiscleroticus TaxID=68238 RepID=A0A918NRB0_9ACTN|nr:WhiB family transcriptional regulator [Streptomyces minutiscleroticus]GGX89440.1 transcriptional regulator WhiB [Streptomyces minutiscleroticus]
MADWRQSAACRTVDPELFFPVGSTGPALLQTSEAKAVCRRCPVSEQCLDWALEEKQVVGVWGGTTENERRAIRRRRSSAAQRRADAA